MNGQAWANLDTGIDLTLTGVTAGQIVAVGLAFTYLSENNNAYVDAVSLVAGSPVKNWSQGIAEGGTLQGFPGWMSPNFAASIGSIARRAVEAGDLSAGSLTIRFRVRTELAANKTITANSNLALVAWAQNLG